MDYIILDIEFNGRKFASDLPMEVIEIGAVRLDSSLAHIDEFSALIKPVYFSKLNTFIKKKTGIPQEAIDNAPGFRKVIADFTAWLQKSESFLLLTWGGEDMKRIVYDTRMHKLDDSFWLAVDYYDLLKGFLRTQKLTNDVSVEGALQVLNLQPEGSAHRALDDARMTAEVFKAVYSALDLDRIQNYKDVYSNAKERRLIKNALRSLWQQKQAPQWTVLHDRYLKDKPQFTDPRKLQELEAYFAAEVAKGKPVQKKPAPTEAGQAAGPESGNRPEGNARQTGDASRDAVRAEGTLGEPSGDPSSGAT